MVESVVRDVVQVDALIFGGGIAGLWTLARLRRLGYSALLLETRALGAGQTIASQGIIHGGVKYALGGEAGRDSAAVRDMPEAWRDCLAGRGELDLGAARVLSDRCFMWTTPGIGARLMGLAASKAIRAAPDRIGPDQRPPALAEAPAPVDVYALAEPVLDVVSVLEALASPHRDAMILAPPESIRVTRGESGIDTAHAHLNDRELEIRAERYIFCAGAGNAAYLSQLGPAIVGFVRMQRRPLHMVMARGDLPELFGHALGAGTTPLATITSAGADGDRVWWIGGKVAEDGVDRDAPAQIDAARARLARILPWIDFSAVRFATWRGDRAEGAQPGGKRPAGPIVRDVGNAVFCWPTKLALAPRAAAEIMEKMPERSTHAQPALDAPRPEVASYPWSESPEWRS